MEVEFIHLRFVIMSDASKAINGAILGYDNEIVTVNGQRYEIPPPTIFRISGAAYYLSDIREGKTIKEVISSINDSHKVACALSFLICGDTSLSESLSHGTLDEILDGISKAYSLISTQNFTRLSGLARSLANLTAKPRL